MNDIKSPLLKIMGGFESRWGLKCGQSPKQKNKETNKGTVRSYWLKFWHQSSLCGSEGVCGGSDASAASKVKASKELHWEKCSPHTVTWVQSVTADPHHFVGHTRHPFPNSHWSRCRWSYPCCWHTPGAPSHTQPQTEHIHQYLENEYTNKK